MLIDKSPEGYLQSVKDFAKQIGKEDDLDKKLDYLHNYANQDRNHDVDEKLPEEKHYTRCLLFKDFAPYSFEFMMERKNDDGEYVRWFNGGLIFHGNHDGFGSGSYPTLSVCLNPTDGWSIHT